MIDIEDEEDESPPPCWDKGGLYVKAEQCSTCIFRPGNLMSLMPGRLADLTRTTDRADTNVVCHQTLEQPVGAFCKGSVDRNPGRLVQIAERLGDLVMVP